MLCPEPAIDAHGRAGNARVDSDFFVPREIRETSRILLDLRLHVQKRAHVEPAAARFENPEIVRLAANDGVLTEKVSSRRRPIVVVDRDHKIAIAFKSDQIPDVPPIIGIIGNEVRRKPDLLYEAVLLLESRTDHGQSFFRQQFASLESGSRRLSVGNNNHTRLRQSAVRAEIFKVAVEQHRIADGGQHNGCLERHRATFGASVDSATVLIATSAASAADVRFDGSIVGCANPDAFCSARTYSVRNTVRTSNSRSRASDGIVPTHEYPFAYSSGA